MDFASPSTIAAFIAAPCVGSFAATLALRLPAGEPVLAARSACPACGHRLAARDLVPLLSWLVRRGRCGYCDRPIGLVYPATELGCLVVVAWAALHLAGVDLWLACALGWTLLALALADQRALVLPDLLVLPLAAAGLAVAWFLRPAAFAEHALGAAAGFAAFMAVRWAYRALRRREGLGLGDAKLMAAAGAWVAWPGLASVVFLAALAALAVAVARGLPGGALDPAGKIPFGAYLAAATGLVYLYGPLGAA